MGKPDLRQHANLRDDVERYERYFITSVVSRLISRTENKALFAFETGSIQHVAALARLVLTSQPANFSGKAAEVLSATRLADDSEAC